MASSSADDVEEKSEENILYDLTVVNEWPQERELFTRYNKEKGQASVLGRLSTVTQRSVWTSLRTLGISVQKASPCSLPTGLLHLNNCQINWNIGIAKNGEFVAVLQDQFVEIRSNRDDFESVMGRGTLPRPRDPYPQWRSVCWSPDNTMVACSRSNGAVDVYDVVGTLLFSIPGETPSDVNAPVDLSCAVAGLIFTERSVAAPWTAELVVINYHGSLKSYAVDRDHGFKVRHSFLFNTQYPLGVSSIVYHPEANLLIVGGSQIDEAPSQATKEGLTSWRILSDMPHYKLVTDYEHDLHQSLKKSSFMNRMKAVNIFSRNKDLQDGVFKLSMSPDFKFLAVLHFSGKLSMWSVPSLTPLNHWTQEQQPGSDEISPEFTDNPQRRKTLKDLVTCKNLLDINWWNNSAVILSRCTGAVTVSSSKTLKNLLGTSPEWFEPASRVTGAHHGGFFGLEVENIFPQKRRMAMDSDDDDDEEYDDSDGEDVSLVNKASRYTKNMLYYLTDSERFQPPRKKQKIVNRSYRLVCLKSTTPEELYSRKIQNEEYGEALALSRAYGLDSDLVYQRQWRNSPVSIASIQDYLSKIGKRSWVLHECLERMPETIDAMKELLEFGLRGTDLQALIAIGQGEDKGRFILCDPEEGLYEDMSFDDFNPEDIQRKAEMKMVRQQELLKQVDFSNLNLEQKELCRSRLKLLQYLDRLKTYEEILGGVNWASERFNPKFFEKFRSKNIVEAATDYARESDWKALELLMTYHGELLMPHRLGILSNFPETTSPQDYKILLPRVSDDGDVLSWEEDRWREQDWSETTECRSVVQPTHVDLGAFLYEDKPALEAFRDKDLDKELLTEWYKFRACEVERLSRLVDNSVELIKLAIEGGLKEGVTDLLDDLVTMEMLVYDCHVDDSLTFAEVQSMADYAKLELIMSKSSPEMYTKNLHRWMVPFLLQCERRTAGAFSCLLRDYVVTRAKSDLTLCYKIFEASKITLVKPVIPRQEDLMSMALEAVYNCERDDQLNVICDILQCLPQKGFGTESPKSQELHKQVDILERHISAAKILEEYGLKKPLFYIRDSETNADETKSLMVKLTRTAGRSKVHSQMDWKKLHTDVLELQDKVYRCISAGLCHEIFTESLLCSSTKENITLAGEYLERCLADSKTSVHSYQRYHKVPFKRSIQLVVSAAQEYFNSSANIIDPCMDLARSCLNMILDSPPPPEIQEELDLIASLSLLDDFGVTLLPLQVRLSKDRLELVKMAISKKESSYKQHKKILRLSHLLRVDSNDRDDREGKILHLVADAAVKDGDYMFGFEICTTLMDSDYGPAWNVCVDLAWEEDFTDIKGKMELLSFSLTYCTADMIEPILQAKALLESQMMYNTIHTGLEPEDSAETNQSRETPFSAGTALRQTKQILSSTTKTTKSVLSTVADTRWWQDTIKAMKQPTKRQVSEMVEDRNEKFVNQGCHPFYESLLEPCHCDVSSIDYVNMRLSQDPDIEISETVLRTAKLEEMLTDGEKNQPGVEVLLKLANAKLAEDSTLGLAYLLSLPQPLEAEKCFDNFPKTSVTLHLALYYYALQVYTAVKHLNDSDLGFLYRQPPIKVIQKVVNFVRGRPDFDWPEDVTCLVSQLKHCSEDLEDYIQAQTLKSLDRGIDIIRFIDDDEYKTETILGLAMNLESKMYNIAVTLAERYEIPLWDVYMAHLEFLFSDSGLPTEEIEQKVNNMKILPTLLSQPEQFIERMNTYVLPTIDGPDHDRLLYYYTLLPDRADKTNITSDTHVKLLKKLKAVAQGLDYKSLMDVSCNPVAVIVPVLSNKNISIIAKLASKIPDGHGGYLHSSTVQCAWAVKLFWDSDRKKVPESSTAWVHRFESCGETMHKLLPDDVISFIDAIVFTDMSLEKLDLDCRQEIIRRTLKFSRQQGGKKKMEALSQKSTWEETSNKLQMYLGHIESLRHDIVCELSQDKTLALYIRQYDLSRGLDSKLLQLFKDMILDGVDLDIVWRLMSVTEKESPALSTVIKDAMTCITKSLRGSATEELGVLGRSALVCLQDVVESVQHHKEVGGNLASQEDVMMLLRPFCSDESVPVKPRLDVLHILEKSFSLSEEDMILLVLYRTEAIVKSTWKTEEVMIETDINSDMRRHSLWEKLLAQSSSCEQFLSICKLLQLWPPLKASCNRDPGSNTWVQTIVVMMEDKDGQKKVYEIFKEIMNTYSFSTECIRYITEKLVNVGLVIDGAKVVLLVNQEELYTEVIQLLEKMREVEADDEFSYLLLKTDLVSSIVHTVYFPIVIDYLLSRQEPSETTPEFMSVDRLAERLHDSGYEAEAGSLLMRSKTTPSLLQTFSAALHSFSRWRKK